ncbi:MAG: hypothetical protein NT004_14570 [Bacteroidetes bacterium]|nr:hypothetical protein [Bacteroidota bacterium]
MAKAGVESGIFHLQLKLEAIQWRQFNGGNSMEAIQWRQFNGGNSMEAIQWRQFKIANSFSYW